MLAWNVESRIRESVQVIHDPFSTPVDRQLAHKFLEDAKLDSCSFDVGLNFFDYKNPLNGTVLRHFGVQILHDYIRLHWQELDTKHKTEFILKILQLCRTGLRTDQSEETCIKSGIAKLIVEVVKREWPTLWVNFLSDVAAMSTMGESQQEISVLVLTNLAEDTILMPDTSLSADRRKQIWSQLTANITEILGFFQLKIVENSRHYEVMLEKNDQNSAVLYSRIVIHTLHAITAYVEAGISMDALSTTDNELFDILFRLLSFQEVQIAAADTLLTISKRKPQKSSTEQLVHILPFLKSDSVMAISKALKLENITILDLENERQYEFLKQMCQIVVNICSYLPSFSHHYSSYESSLKTLLNMSFSMLNHPSLIISLLSIHMWYYLLKDPNLKQILSQFAEVLLNRCCSLLVRSGLPSDVRSFVSFCSRFEFDDDQEFLPFYSQFRNFLNLLINELGIICPRVLFGIASNKLDQLLTADLASITASVVSDPICLQWDAFAALLERINFVYQKISAESSTEIDGQFFQIGQHMLKTLASSSDDPVTLFIQRNPLIFNSCLTCINSLLPFVGDDVSLLYQCIEKEMSVFILYRDAEIQMNKDVKHLRSHGAVHVLRACKQYGHILKTGFESLFKFVMQLISENTIGVHDLSTLIEATVILSLRLEPSTQQLVLLNIIEDSISFWNSFLSLVPSPKVLISFLGFDSSNDSEQAALNRRKLALTYNTISAVLKHYRPVTNNTCTDLGSDSVVQKLLSIIKPFLVFSRYLVEIAHPALLMEYSTCFRSVYEVSIPERDVSLGISKCFRSNDGNLNGTEKTPGGFIFMQSYLAIAMEHNSEQLGLLSSCLRKHFYSFPQLSDLISSQYLALEHLPDLDFYRRLRRLFKHGLSPFIQNSSEETTRQTIVIPILVAILPSILQRLRNGWISLSTQAETESESDQTPSDEDLVLEYFIRTTTRSLVGDIIQQLVVANKVQSNSAEVTRGNAACTATCTSTSNSEMHSMKDMDLDQGSSLADIHIHVPCDKKRTQDLSPLLQAVLADPVCCQLLTEILFTALTWKDRPTCQRCCDIAVPFLDALVKKNLLVPSVACSIMHSFLLGIYNNTEFGDAVWASLTSSSHFCYDIMRPTLSEITSVMHQLSSCPRQQLEKYDRMLLSPAPKAVKTRRLVWKKLISGAMPVSVSNWHRNPYAFTVQSLPTGKFTGKSAKRKATDVLSSSGAASNELQSLFPNST